MQVQMKTQLVSVIAFFLLSGLLLTGCKTGTKKNAENDIKFNTLQVEETYHLMNNPDYPNCNLQLSFTYPVKYSNSNILSKIQKLFVSSYFGESYENYSPEEAITEYKNDYLAMYKELEDDYAEELNQADESAVGSWYSYYENSSNEILYNKGDLLSYTVNFENYTGGAHGSHSSTNYVINLKTAEFIHEQDIFVDNFEDPLAQLLIDNITDANNLNDSKELENIGYFSVEEIYPNGNFYVDEEGITYMFNEYEIAAYVVGITQVKLPYSKIRHLLKEESPISHLYSN